LTIAVVKQKPKPRESVILNRIREGSRSASGKTRNASLRLAIGDDAALWQPRAGYETILTCDWFLEGSHFLADRHPPESVGWKCLARAVSDIAAMGGEPRCFLLSLALPPAKTGYWLRKFLKGLRIASRKLRCPIAGGDTTRRTDILINITIVGECRRGRAILRSGARPGDAIFVTGSLGEAQRGLQLLQKGRKSLDLHDSRLHKHFYPEPRLAVGAWLARRQFATAMIDLSDGLSSDLPRLCRASGTGARVEEAKLPHVAIRDGTFQIESSATQLALHGGDDYELLFTVAKRNIRRIPARIGNIPITRIGEITWGKRILLVCEDDSVEELKNYGWDPFR